MPESTPKASKFTCEIVSGPYVKRQGWDEARALESAKAVVTNFIASPPVYAKSGNVEKMEADLSSARFLGGCKGPCIGIMVNQVTRDKWVAGNGSVNSTAKNGKVAMEPVSFA